MSHGEIASETQGAPEADLAAARGVLERGNLDQALKLWADLRKRFPSHPEAYLLAARACADAGNFDKAEVLLLEGRLLVPSPGPAFGVEFARIATRRHDTHEAVRRWSFVRQAFPKHPIGWVGGVEMFREAGQPDEAEALLEQAKARFPNEPALPILAASLADVRQDWTESFGLWATVRSRLPHDPIGYIKGARALFNLNQFEQMEALLAEAVQRFPMNAELAVRWAELATHRGRWADAAARWALLRDSQPTNPASYLNGAEALINVGRLGDAVALITEAVERFPAHDDLRARHTDIQLRLATPAAAGAPVPPKPASLLPDARDMRALAMRFESLGGALYGAEFGLFQRDCGAEPLGLLCWTEMGPDNLIAALEAGFEGVGLPENTTLGVHHTQGGPEYFTRDKRFMMSMHTCIKETEISHDKMFGQCCQRLQFLRDKLVDDLRAAARIFVYKITWRTLTDSELARMHAAVRRYGDATLLYVRRATMEKPHGTVEAVKPGLMVGYIDRFSASESGENVGAATESWSLVCRQALETLATIQSSPSASIDDPLHIRDGAPDSLGRMPLSDAAVDWCHEGQTLAAPPQDQPEPHSPASSTIGITPKEASDMSSFADLLSRKRDLDAHFGDIADPEVEREYMSLLRQIDRQCCGILDFRWPGVAAPLYMRCGSSDLSNFGQMFMAKEYGFPLDFAPARILDLGAYAGYAAAYLTTRFPQAEIVCIEPSLANFQMLTLNTAAYSRIRRLKVAVWGHSSNLDVASTVGGDWGVRLTESNNRGSGLPALSIPDILARVGWDRVDYLKCDIEGAELSVFGEAGALIAGMVQCCTVETHDAIAPGSSRVVKESFPNAAFTNTRNGEFEVFVRCNAGEAGSGAVSPVSVLRPETGIRPISLTNVRPEGWAYYMFDTDSCQLHPANRGKPLPELATTVELNGHTAFVCEVSVENPQGHAVDFVVELYSLITNLEVAKASVTVAAGVKQQWNEALGAPAYGTHRVVLRTVMAANAPSNHQAFANWHAPSFRG